MLWRLNVFIKYETIDFYYTTLTYLIDIWDIILTVWQRKLRSWLICKQNKNVVYGVIFKFTPAYLGVMLLHITSVKFPIIFSRLWLVATLNFPFHTFSLSPKVQAHVCVKPGGLWMYERAEGELAQRSTVNPIRGTRPSATRTPSPSSHTYTKAAHFTVLNGNAFHCS